MVTVVKSLVGTYVDYAQAQVRSRDGNKLRLQIGTGGGAMVELDFEVPEDIYCKVYDLLGQAVEAAKPAKKVAPQTKVVIAVPLTLEERVANIEGLLSTILIAN
jgi:hypothetical protein